MPITFSFVEGVTRDQARILLHRIGELPDVETFSEVELDSLNDGGLPPVVIFERAGDDDADDQRAREEITSVLQRSLLARNIEAKA